MARAATTSDVFNAIAEPRRRRIMALLAGAERSVGELVEAAGLDQPSVSKHLAVLRTVGLVSVRRLGRRRLYRSNREGLRPIEDWVEQLDRYWERSLDRVRERAEDAAADTSTPPAP